MHTNDRRSAPDDEAKALELLEESLRQWEGKPITRLTDVADRLWEMDRQSIAPEEVVGVEERTSYQELLWVVTEEVTCDDSGAEYALPEHEREIVSWAGRHLSSGNPVYVRLAEAMAGWIRTLP